MKKSFKSNSTCSNRVLMTSLRGNLFSDGRSNTAMKLQRNSSHGIISTLNWPAFAKLAAKAIKKKNRMITGSSRDLAESWARKFLIVIAPAERITLALLKF